MRRLHPLTLALLAASGLEPAPSKRSDTVRVKPATEQHPPEPPRHVAVAKGRQMGLRSLMGGPVHTHRPEAPNKSQAPSNPKAEARRRQRLRDTIMKRAEWQAAIGWTMTAESEARLVKAGMTSEVITAVLAEEPPPGLLIVDEAGSVPDEVWDSVATDQSQGERHGDADIAGGDGVRDPGRGEADPGRLRP